MAPWRIRFDFLVYRDDEAPELEYALCGFAVERVITIEEANADPESAKLTTRQVSDFCFENFANYRRIAELKLRFREGEVLGRRAAMQRTARGPVFLAMLVDDYRAREGASRRMHDMELVYNCQRQTLWRWLQDAEAIGLVPEGLPHRKVPPQ